MTSFIGRGQELADARRLLSVGRLLTLTGPGGVGKTRLAVRVAEQSRRRFRHGVFLVELDALSDPSLLPQTVAGTLGIRDAAEDALEQLADFVADKQLLLVLDNCEHLVGECAMLARRLLVAAPELRILATSRQVLGVDGELILPVLPLPVPEEAATGSGGGNDVLGLFADRASAVRPTFAVNEGNRQRVLDICRRLDGMPLAIELAAVRLRALSLDELARRLEDRFALLVQGSRTAPTRQRSLGSAVSWSYDLCSPAEQDAWARLSVFAGSFELDAAEAVLANGVEAGEVVSLIAALVDKSVLVRESTPSGLTARYRFLETIRSYGSERLRASGAENTLRSRHLAYYRDLAERYESERFTARQLDWIDRLSAEHANLRAALEFGLSTPEHAPVALEIVARLWNFWFAGGYLREGLLWLERALEANPEPTRGRAEGLWTGAFLSAHSGKVEQARRLLAEGWALADRFDDPLLRAHLALCQGQVSLFEGDLAETAGRLESAVLLFRGLGDLQGLADSLILLAGVRFFLQDTAGAAAAREVLELCEEQGTGWTKTYALWATALHHWLAGNPAEGIAAVQQAIRMERTAHDWTGLAYLLEVLAWCTGGQAQGERCGVLLGAAHTVWRLSGARAQDAPPYEAIDQVAVAAAIEVVGATAYEQARARGENMTVEEIFAYALDEQPSSDPEPILSAPEGELLTPREREVAALLAEGLTNREIAARLTISPRTAEGHVERIFAKLGLTSRTQVIAWMSAYGNLPGGGPSPPPA